MYFTLLGLAVVFLFSGTQVIPTMKNNKRAVTAAWEQAQKDMAGVLPEHFPLPARYAHPVVLDRMIRVLREGRAQNAEEALAVVKADLKALGGRLGVRLSFASEERLEEHLGLTRGSVTPFGVLNDEARAVTVLLDAGLWELPLVGVHPNENTATVVLSPDDLERVVREHGGPVERIEL